jgi:hypothetical protein
VGDDQGQARRREARHGRTLLGEPSLASLRATGHADLRRFPGARTTAAWNASIHGLALKVSEDGPITVFRHGRVVGQMG